MNDQQKAGARNPHQGLLRRDFLKISGVLYLVAAVGCGHKTVRQRPLGPIKYPTEKVDPAKLEFPPSQGYLLVDVAKCQGCLSCMLSCSLAHEGRENLSLARIQVIQDPFQKFPADISLKQCRQCVQPACVKVCPTGALHVDRDNGNIRTIRMDLCEGCFSCVEACPFQTSRSIWNFEEERAIKCDLCADTPFWDVEGGPQGLQACVEVCPVGAIRLTRNIPLQRGEAGYQVNLRGEAWAIMDYAID
ncbi:4Fe-4S dicluster domain-containing protein [candidate division CSSED10-310 bacterium]|uniref:4Fe-4S dicluster domain-containing protein n=1 Tax=candidate division CSSED10-310 bacterium TaxID=2855610 RepID=A0ABV6YZG0_UNCC1